LFVNYEASVQNSGILSLIKISPHCLHQKLPSFDEAAAAASPFSALAKHVTLPKQ
jgi:hypothetical protein